MVEPKRRVSYKGAGSGGSRLWQAKVLYSQPRPDKASCVGGDGYCRRSKYLNTGIQREAVARYFAQVLERLRQKRRGMAACCSFADSDRRPESGWRKAIKLLINCLEKTEMPSSTRVVNKQRRSSENCKQSSPRRSHISVCDGPITSNCTCFTGIVRRVREGSA